MCDYSLHNVVSRPAKVGDKLVMTRFCDSITRGFATVDEPNVAVCLLPGTEVAFENDVRCEHMFLLSCRRRRLTTRWRDFGKSTRIVPLCIMTHSNFRMASSCW